jgi:hypothetical protein
MAKIKGRDSSTMSATELREAGALILSTRMN